MEKNRTDSSTTTISLENLRKCLETTFGSKAPSVELMEALHSRFRPLSVKQGGEGIESSGDMDIVDFLLGCNLLARSTQDKKIKLMFEICDDDDDGCMNPLAILQMLQRLERIFCRETARIDVESQIMLNNIADRRAEKNFHFIIMAIKGMGVKKAWKAKMKEQSKVSDNDSQALTPAQEKKAAADAKAPINLEALNIDEDYLITYREFMQALRSLKGTLYKTLMPRTMSFMDVLNSAPIEKTYEISDIAQDDFYMFRYEMNTIF